MSVSRGISRRCMLHSSLFVWHPSITPPSVCLPFSSLLGSGSFAFPRLSTAIWEEKRKPLFPLQNYTSMEQGRLNKLNYPVNSETYAAFWSVMEIRKVRRISSCPPFLSPLSLINKLFSIPACCLVRAIYVMYMWRRRGGVSGNRPSLNSFLIETLKSRRNFPWEGIRVFVILSLKEGVTGGGRVLKNVWGKRKLCLWCSSQL